jgi:hypothetical protein
MTGQSESGSTNVSEPYLWDRSGPPDDEIVELEALLGRFGAPPVDYAWRPGLAARTRVPRAWLAAAAALLLSCGTVLWYAAHAPRPSWPVVRLAGTPVAGSARVDVASRLPVGEWLETDSTSRASLAVSDIGRLDVDPETRLRLIESREGTHRLSLAHGRVHALIWAPPGQFVIDTPSSRAVDLGCAYTLDVRPDGRGAIDVSAGWVAFEHDGRESFIPAGARCETRPGIGPGTPYRTDAPPTLIEALEALDFGALDSNARRDALGRALAAARPDDAVSLWHLLGTGTPAERDRVFDALSRAVPPPVVVTRQGIRAGDRAMRDAWWNALDLGDASWWRTWKRRWP